MSIEIRDLIHTYSIGTPFEFNALSNINLKINSGEFIGLIGHTGSGKSTLIQHLNGLLKPTKGTIIIDNINLANKDTKIMDIRRRVGLVFQYPEHQIFEETVAKDVAYGPGNLGLDKREIDNRVREALETVNLSYNEIKDKSPFELSGGQMRRVAIAGVLAMKPDILILDEPTAGLDPRGRDEILNQIKEMHERDKITVILVSHSMEDISKYAQRIIVMSKGEICLFDTPSSIFNEAELLERIGLSVPQITQLMIKLHEIDPLVKKNIFNISEATDEIIALLRRRKNV